MKYFLVIFVALFVRNLASAPDDDGQTKEIPIGLSEQVASSEINIEKPLVRCKRPICDDLFCDKGYQLDSRGCETCSCLMTACAYTSCAFGSVCKEKPCTSFPCTTLEAECVDVAPIPPVKEPPPPVIPSLPCPVPMCASPCPYGRKVTSEGCETCECSTAELEPSTQCPMMKCGMCSFGYVRDDNGCHTCNCLPDPCMGKLCPEHQQCTARWDDCFHVPCPKVAVCTWRGLCLYSNDNKKLISDLREPTDNMSTDCNEDGTFNPVQCNGARNQCWCIDDTGREIEKTHVPVYADDDLPTCPFNKTVSIQMTFVLESEENIDVKMPAFKTTVHEHVSRWLLIEKHYINELEVWQEPDAVIVVSYVVVHDGKTDLPSAASHLRRQMQRGQCNIDFHGNKLTPRSDSLDMQHTFEPIAPPRISNPGLLQSGPYEKCFLKRWYRYHPTTFLVGAIGGFVILTFVSVVIVSVLMKRRYRMVQFRHKRMNNYQKSLSLVAESSYLSVVEDKKMPVDNEEAEGLCSSTEKLVPVPTVA